MTDFEWFINYLKGNQTSFDVTYTDNYVKVVTYSKLPKRNKISISNGVVTTSLSNEFEKIKNFTYYFNIYSDKFARSDNFIITGKDAKGKRFKPISTSTPRHYNIYSGTVWMVNHAGSRKKVRVIVN